MLTILREQKTHIIYGVVIVLLASVAYHFLVRKPTEIIKTKVETRIETKVINRDVLKTRIVYIDKVIQTKKTNGDVVTETDHTLSEYNVTDKSKSTDTIKDTISQKEVIKFMNNYSVDVMYPITVQNIYSSAFNPLNLQVMGGMRIFDFPLFVTAGSDGHFNKILVGLRLEF